MNDRTNQTERKLQSKWKSMKKDQGESRKSSLSYSDMFEDICLNTRVHWVDIFRADLLSFQCFLLTSQVTFQSQNPHLSLLIEGEKKHNRLVQRLQSDRWFVYHGQKQDHSGHHRKASRRTDLNWKTILQLMVFTTKMNHSLTNVNQTVSHPTAQPPQSRLTQLL